MIFKNFISGLQKYFLCLFIILAGCKGQDKTANLLSIAITPLEARIDINEKQQLTATGTYSDKSTRDMTSFVTWHSSNPVTATIAPTTGLATGVAYGSSQIIAILGDIHSNVATLNVVTYNIPNTAYYGPLVAENPTLPSVLIKNCLAGEMISCEGEFQYNTGFKSEISRGIVCPNSGSVTVSFQLLDCGMLNVNSWNGTVTCTGTKSKFVEVAPLSLIYVSC